jgi:hypothetical protein
VTQATLLNAVSVDQARQLINPAIGQPLVAHAYKREELYHGPHAERAPDIVFILAEDYTSDARAHPPLIITADPPPYTRVNGEHRRHGVLVVRGLMIRQNTWVLNARLVDVVPTILSALGMPVPQEIDGVVLEDRFSPLYREAHPVQYSDQGPAGDIPAADTGLASERRNRSGANWSGWVVCGWACKGNSILQSVRVSQGMMR